jgi:hypothetical protein
MSTPVQMSFQLIPLEDTSSDELKATLVSLGWEFRQHWERTQIYQFYKPGYLINLSRKNMILQIKKDRAWMSGDMELYYKL